MSLSLHRFANPGRFLRIATRVQPFLTWPGLIITAAALLWGLLLAPADYQQGDAVRIIYIHVPTAWLSTAGYAGLAAASLTSLVWRHPLADMAAAEIGPVGAAVTFVCLATGAIWGKPMWGAWWVWDARLTSELVLLFLYLGHIMLIRAFDDAERGARAGAILALIGVINLPIIHYSVQWWNTLHQANSIGLTGSKTMDGRIVAPMLTAMLGCTFGFAAITIARLRAAVMERRLRSLLAARVESVA